MASDRSRFTDFDAVDPLEFERLAALRARTRARQAARTGRPEVPRIPRRSRFVDLDADLEPDRRSRFIDFDAELEPDRRSRVVDLDAELEPPQDSYYRDLEALLPGAGGDGDRPGAVAEAATNFLPSLGRAVVDMTAPIHSPIDTGKGLYGLGKGLLDMLFVEGEQPSEANVRAVAQHFKDRYGSREAIARTFREDSGGLALDLASVLLTGGTVLGAKTAAKLGGIVKASGGTARTAAAVERGVGAAGRAATRAGEVLNVPGHLARAGGLAARGVGRGAAAVSGALTGEGGDVLRGAFRAGRDVDAGETFRATMRPGDGPDPDRVVRGQFGSQDIDVPGEIPIDGPEVLAWDRARREAEASRITSAQLNKTAKPPPLRVHPAITPETWERLAPEDRFTVAEAWRRQLPNARRQILDQLADTPQPGPSSRLFDSPAKTRPLAEVAATPVPWGRVRAAVEKALEGEHVGGVKIDRSPGNATATKRIRKLLEDWEHLPADQGRTVERLHDLAMAIETTGGKRPPDVVRRARAALDGVLFDAAPEYADAIRIGRSAAESGGALSTWAPRSGVGRVVGLGSLVGAFENPMLLFGAGATSPRLAGEIAHGLGRLPVRPVDPRAALIAAMAGRHALQPAAGQ